MYANYIYVTVPLPRPLGLGKVIQEFMFWKLPSSIIHPSIQPGIRAHKIMQDSFILSLFILPAGSTHWKIWKIKKMKNRKKKWPGKWPWTSQKRWKQNGPTFTLKSWKRIRFIVIHKPRSYILNDMLSSRSVFEIRCFFPDLLSRLCVLTIPSAVWREAFAKTWLTSTSRVVIRWPAFGPTFRLMTLLIAHWASFMLKKIKLKKTAVHVRSGKCEIEILYASITYAIYCKHQQLQLLLPPAKILSRPRSARHLPRPVDLESFMW